MQLSSDKKTIFSGIQPSGDFTIGNYFGALKNWAILQDGYNPIFCVVDEHAITVPQDPNVLRQRIFQSTAILLALGIDPERSILFIQSHVSAHAELAWLLNCNSYMGELSRMTQFKDKSAKLNDESIRVGLFDYPVLMAADILLYNADLVPVGEDQRQHLELSRDIAVRFNQAYGPTFVVPEGYYGSSGAKIYSLQDPTKKMSKSDENKSAYILMVDDEDTILNKFKRAVTDSESEIRYDPKAKPGISNLLDIYCAATGQDMGSAVASFDGLGYGQLKTRVGEAVAAALAPIQKEYSRLLGEKAYVDEALKKGAEQAREIANPTLKDAQEKMGFYHI